jgi:hypothetical protein
MQTNDKNDSAFDYLKNRLENRNIAISHKPFIIDMQENNTVSLSSDTIFLDKPKKINVQEVKHMYGKLIHESGHARYTNLNYDEIRDKIFGFIREYYNLKPSDSISNYSYDCAFNILNIIEDFRINVLLSYSHEGAFNIMQDTHNDMVEGKTFTTGKNALLPLLMGLKTCKYDLNPVEKQKTDKAFDIIKPVGTSTDKNICLKILPKVYEIFYPDKTTVNKPVDKNLEGEIFIDFDNEKNNNVHFKPKTKKDKKEIEENTKKAIKENKHKKDKTESEKTVKEIKKEIEETVKELKKEIEKTESENNNDKQILSETDNNIKKEIEKYLISGDGQPLEFIQEIETRKNTYEYNKTVNENRNIINRLINEFKTLIIQNDSYLTGLKTGKIDIKRMCRIVTNNDSRIFKKRNEKTFGNIAFLLMVDSSGSMYYEEKYLKARKTAIILHEILRQTNIKHSIIGFSADCKSIFLPRPKSNDKQKCFSVNHIVYKTFENNTIAYNLSEIQYYGNNRDGNTLRIAREYFKGITEKKVLIVISDGQPNAYGYGERDAIKDTIESQRELKKHGIKIINIGIGNDYQLPVEYLNKIKIDKPVDLTKKLLTILKRELTI